LWSGRVDEAGQLKRCNRIGIIYTIIGVFEAGQLRRCNRTPAAKHNCHLCDSCRHDAGLRRWRVDRLRPTDHGEKGSKTRHQTNQENGCTAAGHLHGSKAVNPDNLQTNSATVSDESTQESYRKNNEKPLVLAILGSLPSAGLRKVEYGSTAGNLTICRQILPQSAMSPHKSEEPPSDKTLATR